MNIIHWQVELLSAPPVFKYCKKCACKTAFLSSGLFRVNAQKRNLDVWLIYKCSQCDTTWNAEVLSRVSPRSIPAELLEGFHGNDAALARRCAADPAFLRRNGAEPGLPEYRVIGVPLSLGEEAELEIRCEADLPVKISTLLRRELSLSGSCYGALVHAGRITSPDGRDLIKGKLHSGIRLHFYPED